MSKLKDIKQTINKIDNILLKIPKLSELEKENYFWDNHPDIMNNYPFLVTQIISSNDRTMLNFMLSKLEEIEKGEIEKEAADVDVGQEIVDKLIKPQLKE